MTQPFPHRYEEARKLVETAKKYCIVSHGLKRPVEGEAAVGPAADAVRVA